MLITQKSNSLSYYLINSCCYYIKLTDQAANGSRPEPPMQSYTTTTRRFYFVFTCNADQNSSRHRTSNSAWDTNQAVPWPRVLGSLMTSTSFGLNGAMVSTEDRAFWSICWAGGEHGSGWETCCKDLWWAELQLEIATGSMFQVPPPFLVFSKVIFPPFLLLTFCHL